MRRIRAAFLTPTLLMGGAERWLISLARKCDRQRIEWTGTALTHAAPASSVLGREMSAYMPIFAGPGAGAGARQFIVPCRSARAALDAAVEKADVLIAWGVPNLSDLVRGHRLPVVLVSHGSGPWAVAAVQQSEPGATHYVGVSEPAIQPFSAPVRARAQVLHNGIDIERCTPTVTRAQTRAQWGFTDQQLLIGHVGRYSPEKNPAAAAQAAAQLGGNFRALYAGQGWLEAALRKQVAKIAGSRAVFVPPDRNTGNLLSAIDVFLLASPAEGFSLALAEAWYRGVPVVATRVGAVPELERLHGELVSPVPVDPSPQALATAVKLALSPAFRPTIARAQRMVAEHYTAGAMGRRWSDYLASICERRALRRLAV